MYCMKPPVKKVPEGDWYCVDCRPKETKRTPRPRKRPVRLEEFVDDIDEVQSVEESYVEASEIEGDLSVVGEDSGTLNSIASFNSLHVFFVWLFGRDCTLSELFVK